MKRHTLMVVIGTRPEAIKMAPLVHALRACPGLAVHLCVTGQHREMLDQVLELFDLEATTDLAVMTEGQTLNGLTQRLVSRLDRVYRDVQPRLVLAHGDTTTCFAATLAAFHRQIPVAHVEAGLRTGNPRSPMPEEAYRRMTATLADLHFAPTAQARDNLLREGVAKETVEQTGNTVIDALLWMRRRVRQQAWQPGPQSPLHGLRAGAGTVLVTAHRRENLGPGLDGICRAVAELASRYPAIDFVYPVHPNPRVEAVVRAHLSGRENVLLTPPQDYRGFVWLMDRATLLLTDSGGIQEEAPALGKPVLVMRDSTERPEALAGGAARLVGNRTACIVDAAVRVLEAPDAQGDEGAVATPYGDGQACARIVRRLEHWLSTHDRLPEPA